MRELMVVGVVESADFVVIEATLIYLGRLLPRLKYNLTPMMWEEYKGFVDDLLRKQKWSLRDPSVVVGWISGPGPVLLGNASNVLEYLDKVYGVKRVLSNKRAQAILPKRVKMFKENLERLQRKAKEKYTSGMKIAIWGAGCQIRATALLAGAALESVTGHFFDLLLYDKHAETRPALETLKKELAPKYRIRVAEGIDEVFENTDLLLIFGDFDQIEEGDEEAMSERATREARELGELIGEKASPGVRVVVGFTPKPCLAATVLSQAARSIPPRRILAVTSHYGRMLMGYVTEVLQLREGAGIPSPVVWGLPGQLSLVELMSSQSRLEEPVGQGRPWRPGGVRGPPKARLKRRPVVTNTGAQYLSRHWDYLAHHKANLKGENSYVAEVWAIVEIITKWFNPAFIKAPTTAGAYSRGEWGFPVGLFVSQPVARGPEGPGGGSRGWAPMGEEAWSGGPPASDPRLPLPRLLRSLHAAARALGCHHRDPELAAEIYRRRLLMMKTVEEFKKHPPMDEWWLRQLEKGTYESWGPSIAEENLVTDYLEEILKDDVKVISKKDADQKDACQKDAEKRMSLDSNRREFSGLSKGSYSINDSEVRFQNQEPPEITESDAVLECYSSCFGEQSLEELREIELEERVQDYSSGMIGVGEEEQEQEPADSEESQSFCSGPPDKPPNFEPPEKTPNQSDDFYLSLFCDYVTKYEAEVKKWQEEVLRENLREEMGRLGLGEERLDDIFKENRGREKLKMAALLVEDMAARDKELEREGFEKGQPLRKPLFNLEDFRAHPK